MSRIVIRPGPVISKTDGDRHYIGVGQLERLYQLTPVERARAVVDDRRLGHRDDDIVLRPRFDGDYRRPAALDA